jgi:uncharacterized protein (TIRG00374 family)
VTATSRPAEPAERGWVARHRRTAVAVLGVILVVGFFYYVVPQIAGLGPTLSRLRGGDLWWLALGVVLESISIGAEVGLFNAVFSRPTNRIGWRTSAEVTLAGSAATKLLATAGAGGIALTIWALRGAGMASAEVATGMVCYEILTYAVYMGALVIGGFGLWFGIFAGRAPVGVTLVPALFGLAVIVVVGSMWFLAGPAERRLRRWADAAHGRPGRWLRRAVAVPRALRSGLQACIVIGRRGWPLLWPVAAWGFDIAVLGVAFRAFGHVPSPAVLVVGYYVGTLANTLPLPGGIGGVEGGMIGAFLAFGVNGSLAVLAVLSYRTISYWLPTVPGAVAYFELRHRMAAWHAAGQATAGAPA